MNSPDTCVTWTASCGRASSRCVAGWRVSRAAPLCFETPAQVRRLLRHGSDVEAMRAWITGRICETRQLADEARAVTFDIEDRLLLDATVQLAADLEAFAAKLTARLVESEAVP